MEDDMSTETTPSVWTDEALRSVSSASGLKSEGRLPLWREALTQESRLLAQLAKAPLPEISAVSEVSGPPPVIHPRTEEHRSSVQEHAPGALQEKVEMSLREAERQKELNAFTSLLPDQARTAAIDVEGRLSRGEQLPLAGWTFAVKDLTAVKGYATTGGTRALRRSPSKEDAVAVNRVREAGGLLIGMANLHALAYGALSTSSDAGRVGNPRAAGRLAGGSSGGSAAAVAAGIVDLALGTDTGGSIRVPAALCGVVGLKPTHGRIPSHDTYPLAPSLDHVGPITRTVREAAAALEVLSTEPFKASETAWTSLKGVVVGIPRQFVLEDLAHEVRQAMDQAIAAVRDLGGTCVSVDLPSLEYAAAAQLITISSEAFASNYELISQRPEELPSDVRLRLELGAFRLASDYVRAQHIRAWMRQQMSGALNECHVLMWPTVAVTAPAHDAASVRLGKHEVPVQSAMTRLAVPYNLTGFPAVSLPWGSDNLGAGIGIQLGAAPMQERILLGAANALESHRKAMGAGEGLPRDAANAAPRADNEHSKFEKGEAHAVRP
jgi:aspartyl-tRNA(Asn)/glutamyl-tRNA(Gln) amidotransferase subunit A